MKNKKKIISLLIVISLIMGITVLTIIYNNKKEKKTVSSNNENRKKNTTSIEKINNDKMPPILNLKSIKIKYGKEYDIEDFIDSCTDNSNIKCILNYTDEGMSKITEVGTHNIEIIAIDKSGNTVVKKTELTITEEENDKTNNNATNINKKSISSIENENKTSNSYNKEENNNKTIINDKNEYTTNKINNQQNINSETKKEEVNRPNCSDKIKDNMDPAKSNNFIKYEKEEMVTDTTYKYGDKIETITTITYAVYSDIGKCEYKKDNYEIIDKSTFNATASDMKNEAITILNSNLNDVKNVGIKTLNSYRNEVNKNNLEYDYELSLAATIRAIEMYYSSKFDHTRPNGSNCFSIYSELGIQYSNAGENIAYGYGYLSSAMTGWKNSPGHYANMINDYFRKVGIGYYNRYYVTLFK